MSTQNLKEEVQSLFEQAGASPEISDKLSSLFEAGILANKNQIQEEFDEKLQAIEARLVEEKEAEIAAVKEQNIEELAEQVNAYLDYFADEWMEKNTLAVESGLRVEIAENFINNMLKVFKENYVDLPEEKYDLVASLKEQVSTLEGRLNEQVEKNISIKNQLKEQKRASVFASVTKDLTDTEIEKVSGLVEGIDYENDDSYREKLELVVETYIGKPSDKPSIELDFIDLDEEIEEVIIDKGVKSLVESLDRLAPKN